MKGRDFTIHRKAEVAQQAADAAGVLYLKLGRTYIVPTSPDAVLMLLGTTVPLQASMRRDRNSVYARRWRGEEVNRKGK